MRNAGVRRINNAVRRLDFALVENELNPPDGSDGTLFELCAATRDDWNRYVQSENQALGSRWMAWWDDKVFIVDLPTALHEVLFDAVRRAITEATGTGVTHLACYGATYIGDNVTLPDDIRAIIANLEPDCSFGPDPGAVLPPGFMWEEFQTLKVEVGVSQGWGARVERGQAGQQGQQREAGQRRLATLNEKANAWRLCPGVEYVLCIRISRGLRVREYRLDSIVNGQFEDPNMQPAPIENNTVIQFDPWRLLGIPQGRALPAGFNNPVQFNLLNAVERIIQREQRDIDFLQAQAAADDDDVGEPPRRRHRLHQPNA
ncbi:hypothetical protein PsorP6_003112 [Peronosclerospora sorghi]|uniref:Uncharacterized protein n=1 Tax=Peronosclerospora sorghi TaxID=230839 RepID=A0ACC0VPY5_9STRA|nr:hypothetical protein PsorP6_003112 [Peronosclerospora sorghi]